MAGLWRTHLHAAQPECILFTGFGAHVNVWPSPSPKYGTNAGDGTQAIVALNERLVIGHSPFCFVFFTTVR